MLLAKARLLNAKNLNSLDHHDPDYKNMDIFIQLYNNNELTQVNFNRVIKNKVSPWKGYELREAAKKKPGKASILPLNIFANQDFENYSDINDQAPQKRNSLRK
jgi:hypothetical protein